MISQKKIEASRKNSLLGGYAYAEKMKSIYNKNPSFCLHCNLQLPQEKKNNKFCSSSCSATYNNTGRIKKSRYKCFHCENLIYKGKFCSTECSVEGRRKYKTNEEAKEIKRKRVREISANYRAKLKNQTPQDADRKAIREFYEKCPSGFEVDHIIPISKGGLHTLSNLQYLSVIENRRKSNKIL